MTRALLHVEDVAELLGFSVRTVHELTRKRAIPCRRIPGTRRVLFLEAELLAWVAAGGVDELELVKGRAGGFVVRPKAPA